MSEISPYIQTRIGAGNFFEVLNDEGSGSAANTANQQFDIAVNTPGVLIGQKVVVTDCQYRGDFSAANEFVDVGFELATNPKTSVGAFAAADSSVYASDPALVGSTFELIDIGGGTPGIRMFISPSAAVNFSPGGMPNGWWWQLNLSFQALSY